MPGDYTIRHLKSGLTRAVLCLILAGLAARSLAQEKNSSPKTQAQKAPPSSTPEPAAQEPTIRVDTDLLVIDVTATDAAGNYVRNLRQDDFQVYEDGQLRKIDFFNVTNEVAFSRPLAVVFALDLSKSLKPEEIETLHQAARKFTEILKGESVFAVMTFNYNVKIIQGFTSDARKIEKSFAQTLKFEGSTRLYDALDRAVTMLDKRPLRSHQGFPLRRVIIVITDGFDSSSIIDRRELIRRANVAGVTVYSVTLPSYMLSPTHTGERVITLLDASRIVTATGGRDFDANAQDFTPIFKALAEEIRASYGLAYYPEVRDGKYRSLRVTTSRPGIQLRVSRSGYTAPTK